MWWKRLLGFIKTDEAETKKKDVSMIAKCIGCGQCAQGCPMKVTITKKQISDGGNYLQYPGKAIIFLIILLLISLSGCSQRHGSEAKQPEKYNAAQKTEISQSEQPSFTVNQAQAAESEDFYNKGLKLYGQYEYQGAIANYDRAIAAHPANYKVYTAKGIALCFEGDYKGGMALIEKTLETKPDYVPAFYDMAMAHKLQDEYDKAIYWFEKTIQGDPKNTWSYYGIATIYADRESTKDSLAYLKKAIDLDPVVKEVAKEQDHFAKMRKLPEFQALVR